MSDVDDRMRQLLRDRAEDIPSHWEMPPRLKGRARRRAVLTFGAAVLTVAVLAFGALAGVRSLIRSEEPQPADRTPLPVVTKANGEIAFVGNSVGDGDLHLVDPSTGETSVLVRRCAAIEQGCAAWITSVDWSPDGTRLAYSLEAEVGRVGPAGIYVLDIGSGETTRLTSCSDPCWSQTELDWSPDGTRIAYTLHSEGICSYAMGFNGTCSISIVGTDGSDPVELPTGSLTDPVDPSWSPDGSHIAFSARDGKRAWFLYTVATDGSDLTAVTTTDRVSTSPLQPAWSPEGKEIAFRVARAPSDYMALWTVANDGSDPTFVADLGCCAEAGAGADLGRLEWSPDGTRITVIAGAPQSHLLILGRNGSRIADLGEAWWVGPSWQAVP